MAENVTISVSRENKDVWSRFKARHSGKVSPKILELIKKDMGETA